MGRSWAENYTHFRPANSAGLFRARPEVNMPPLDETARRRLTNLCKQRAAKQEIVIRLLAEIDGITSAIDDQLAGDGTKAAHADFLLRVKGA